VLTLYSVGASSGDKHSHSLVAGEGVKESVGAAGQSLTVPSKWDLYLPLAAIHKVYIVKGKKTLYPSSPPERPISIMGSVVENGFRSCARVRLPKTCRTRNSKSSCDNLIVRFQKAERGHHEHTLLDSQDNRFSSKTDSSRLSSLRQPSACTCAGRRGRPDHA
jgi:hypothetical protein